MKFIDPSLSSTIERYTRRFNQHGYSPLSLGWSKGKQQVRFDILTSQVDLEEKNF